MLPFKLEKDNISYFFHGLRKKRLDCPYCHTNPFVFDRKYLVIDICKCPSCGLFFVNPQHLSKESSGSFYSSSYHSDATVMPDIKTLESIKQNNFRGSAKDYNKRLEVIRELSNGNDLLEFGASWGYFLFQSMSYGFKPTGIEISTPRAKYGTANLGVSIYPNIESVKGKFSVICSFHTLEHLSDISGLFDTFYEKLLPGGSLIIEVPNFDPEIKGKSVYSLVGKIHPLGFNSAFFEANIKKHGFRNVSICGNYSDLIDGKHKKHIIDDVIIVHATK